MELVPQEWRREIGGPIHPRRYGERVFSAVPQNSLIIGPWDRIMPLYYLRYVEGMRPDIQLEPFWLAHMIRLRRWQDAHNLTAAPFVFLYRYPQVLSDVTELDSIQVGIGQFIYVRRQPLELP